MCFRLFLWRAQNNLPNKKFVYVLYYFKINHNFLWLWINKVSEILSMGEQPMATLTKIKSQKLHKVSHWKNLKTSTPARSHRQLKVYSHELVFQKIDRFAVSNTNKISFFLIFSYSEVVPQRFTVCVHFCTFRHFVLYGL